MGDAGITYQYRALTKRLLPNHFALMNEVSFAVLSLSLGFGPFFAAKVYTEYGFHVVCLIVAALAILGAILVSCSLSSQ